MKENSGSKISNIEWGIVIGALFIVDLIQIILEWLLGLIGISEIIIPLIDIFVGLSFGLYLHLRGQSVASPKRFISLISTLFLEMVPVVDELPLWGLDGIFNMMMSKSDVILSQIPGGGIVSRNLRSEQGNLNSGNIQTQNQRKIPLESKNYPVAKQTGRPIEETKETRDGIGSLVDPQKNKFQPSKPPRNQK